MIMWHIKLGFWLWPSDRTESKSCRWLTILPRWWSSCWGWWCAAACSSWGCTGRGCSRQGMRWFLKLFLVNILKIWRGKVFLVFYHYRCGAEIDFKHLSETNICTSTAWESTFFWLKVNTDSFRVWFLHRSQVSDLLHNKLDRAHSVGFLWILLHYAAKSITTFQASWRWER